MSDRQRTLPSRTADDRASLTGFLQYERVTLLVKCAGLSAALLRERAVQPSALSLLGIVRHLAEVERSWFQVVWLGEAPPRIWRGAEGSGLSEFDVEEADPDEAFRVWHEECARSREVVEAAGSIDATVSFREDGEFSLRYILTHMIEEYARHNGHADFLRERLDGVTGE